MSPLQPAKIGLVGACVAANVRRLREAQGLTQTELARRATEAGTGGGGSLNQAAIKAIEAVERRVDADELVALAAGLRVSPITLLQPHQVAADTVVIGDMTASTWWEWLRARQPFGAVNDQESLTFWTRSLPPWALTKIVAFVRTTDE